MLPSLLDNPKTVSWSHSDRQADFYELPTDGLEMQEALSWLLRHYSKVKLWMGAESDHGTEIYLTCAPARQEAVVSRLIQYEDDFDIAEHTLVAS